MKAWEVDIICPLCGIKTRLNRLQRHKNRKHPEYTLHEYEELIETHIKKGAELFNTKRVPTSKVDAVATKLLMKQKGQIKRVTSIVSGGAIELGKKR